MTPLDAYRSVQQGRIDLDSVTPGVSPEGKRTEKREDGASFQSVLGDLVREVNGLQKDADRSIEGLITGETTNIHDVTTRMSEAGIAFGLMMEVRNKLLDAYQQIMRMQA